MEPVQEDYEEGKEMEELNTLGIPMQDPLTRGNSIQ